MSKPQTLVAVLSSPTQILLLLEDAGDTISVANRVFHDAGSGEWIGFYDWLRGSDGVLKGVRSWAFTSDGQAVEELRAKNAVDIEETGELRLWFSDDKQFDELASDDQDLGLHRLMKSKSGEVALTFATDALSDDEIMTLRRLAA